MTPDTDINEHYLFLAVFIAVAVTFPLLPLAVAWLWHRFFQPGKAGQWKNAIYECGVGSTGPARVQFRARYHLYCIIFLIFDVEAIFLIPFAAAFTGLPVSR
jgi:NADH:ubiquinone oxidoreductase subunit 3 (subunit A)